MDADSKEHMLLNGRVEEATIQLVRGKELQVLNKKSEQQKLKEELCSSEKNQEIPAKVIKLLKTYSKVFKVPI